MIRKPALTCFLLFTILLMYTTGCGSRLSRTTTVYGKVLNEARQPIDSIRVAMWSAGFANASIPLKEAYTDKDGNYSIVLDVPKDYSSVTVFVPYVGNPKFALNYKDTHVYENGQRTNNCCIAAIGQKSNYDFILLNK